jgi:hypothetical protein
MAFTSPYQGGAGSNIFADNQAVTIVAAALQTLREFLPVSVNCQKDFSSASSEIGKTFVIQRQNAISTSVVAPNSVVPQDGGRTYDSVNVTFGDTSWQRASFTFTPRDNAELMLGQLVPECIAEASRSLGKLVEGALYAAATRKVYGRAGAYNADPFASNINQVATLRKVLTKQLCPMENRHLVLGQEEYTSGLQLDDFKKYINAGDSEAFRQGKLGNLYGFNLHETQVRPLPAISGTMTAGFVTDGASVVDASTLACTGTCNLLVGDLITVTEAATGVAYDYVITAATGAISGTTVTLSVEPKIQIIHTTGSAITKVGGATATYFARNLAFQSNAFALIMRIPGMVDGMPTLGSPAAMQDPVSGIPMKCTIYPGYEQVRVELSILFAVECIDPRRAAWLIGTGL